MTSEVTAELRRRLIRGEFGNGFLPGERKLRETLGASRITLKTALAVLQAEGLLESVPQYGWQILDLHWNASFDTFSSMLVNSPPQQWPSMVRQLLDHRANTVIAAVDSLVVNGGTTRTEAKVWFIDIMFGDDRRNWESECRVEDKIFTELLITDGNLPQTLAAHQLRRAFEAVRSLVNVSFFVDTQRKRFHALFDAIDAGDRHRAVALVTEAVTCRDPMYMRLVGHVAGKLAEKPGQTTGLAPAENGLT